MENSINQTNNSDFRILSFPNTPIISQKKEHSGICIHEIVLEGIKIIYLENTSPNRSEYNPLNKENAVSFYYQFSGEGQFFINQKEQFILESNEQIYSTNTTDKSKINLGAYGSCCYIQLKSKFIDAYLKQMEAKWLLDFPHHNHLSRHFQKHQLPITPPMRECIEEIFHSKRTGMFLKLHIESLVLKLLMLQFEQMENHDCSIFCSLKKSDINKIYAAKKIITNTLNQWITVNELAAAVGTNEYTLKKGFKELFGSPIFEFTKNYKMAEAHKMLYNKEMNISYVSDCLGYKNVTHFSAAFKRTFGFRPSEIK